MLTGSGLWDASEVTFGGVPAAFSIVDDDYIACQVPAGATTGAVAVVTPFGTPTGSFTVTEAPAAPKNTAPSVITGTPSVGQTLSCTEGTWSSSPTSYSYKWLRDGQGIGGATSNSYVVTSADQGCTLSCEVTASNAAGSAGPVVSSNSLQVPPAATAPKNTVAPVVSGTPAVGQTLSCSQGSWSGTTPITYKCQWLSGGVAISGATSAGYVVTTADQGCMLSCEVIASNAGGSNTATSNSVSVPAAATVPVNTAAVVLSGTPSLGQTLSCSPGSWSGSPTPSCAYQWLRNGAAIGGATSTSYVVTTADQGCSLSCRVTATNSAGSASATSNALSVPARTSLPPAVTLKATPHSLKVGAKLRLSGAVSNAISGDTSVRICRRASGKLTTLKTLAINGSGSFRYTFKPSRAGSWVLVACYTNSGTTYSSGAITAKVLKAHKK